jgi:hypothetical protein
MASYRANAMPQPHRTGHVGEKALRASYPATELLGAGQVSKIWTQISDSGPAESGWLAMLGCVDELPNHHPGCY